MPFATLIEEFGEPFVTLTKDTFARLGFLLGFPLFFLSLATKL